MLELVRVSEKYLPVVVEAVKEYKTDENPYKVAGIMELVEAIEKNQMIDWLEERYDEDRGINLKPGYVAATSYWLMEDGKYVGSFVLRHKLTDSLMNIGGHIAYIILPSKREQGYAFKGLSLCLAEAKKMGIDKVLITCHAKNSASFALIKKAMQEYGGEILPDIALTDGFEHRAWVNTIA